METDSVRHIDDPLYETLRKIAGARISGCFSPSRLEADEIVMSLNHGTRMRYSASK